MKNGVKEECVLKTFVISFLKSSIKITDPPAKKCFLFHTIILKLLYLKSPVENNSKYSLNKYLLELVRCVPANN